MTLDRLLATGSAQICARLEIEGLAIMPVSDPGMERTDSDGRRRVCCLPPMGEGIIIEDEVNLPEAKLEAQGVSIRLYETADEDVSEMLWHGPDVTRFATSSISDSATTLTLISTSGIANGDVIHWGTEAISVGTVASSTSLTGCTRAYWGTIAQKHWSNEGGVPYSSVTNRPLKIRGRRARVFLYEDADDLQGDGTQVWIGHVTADPVCTDAGTEWRLQLGSISERLKSKLGGELEFPQRPRGIYYPASAALLISIQEAQTGTGLVGGVPSHFTGFYETQRAFCEELTTFLADYATDNSLVSTYTAIEEGDGRWTIHAVVGTAVTAITFFCRSEQDGATSATVNDVGSVVEELAVGDNVYAGWASVFGDERLVPRGFFGHGDPLLHADTAAAESFTPYRIYLGAEVTSDWDMPQVEWADGTSILYYVDSRDTSANWISLTVFGLGVGDRFYATRFGAFSMPSIHPTRQLATGHLGDLRDGLVAESIEFANRGTAPFVTTEDLGDWSTVAEQAARGRAWLTQRAWTLATSVDLEEVLAHEWMLYSVFPVIENDGRIGIRILDMPNATTANAVDIDDEVISAGWSSIAAGNQTINRVVLYRFYDAREDEWDDNQVLPTQNVDSYAQDHQDRPLEIKPRSRAVGGDGSIGPEDATIQAGAVLGLFGYPHAFVEVNVPWTLFGLTLGSVVTFSAEHLPDYRAGARPIVDIIGIVVKRRWALGEAHGSLRILTTFQNVAGYAPTAHIDSQSNVSGNTWNLTVDHELYAPTDESGAIVANTDTFFTDGDAVRIVKYDSETASSVSGDVVSVNTTSHVIQVTLDGAWTPGADQWELIFDTADVVVDGQDDFCFIGNADGAVAGLDNSEARTYGP